MNGEALGYLVALLTWGAVVYRLPTRPRDWRDQARRALWLTLVAMALTLTVRLTPVSLAIGRVAGVPGLARLLEMGLALLAAWCTHLFLLHRSYPATDARQRGHRPAWWAVASFVGTSLFFAFAAVDEEVTDYWTLYRDRPFLFEARLAFFAYFVPALVQMGRLTWRYAAPGREPSFRLGLRLNAIGVFLACGLVAGEALYGAVARYAADALPLLPLAQVPAAAGEGRIAVPVALMVLGVRMPAWGPRVGVSALCIWAARYQYWRRLTPLWRDLTQAAPEVVLLPSSGCLADAVPVRDLRLRLYRRVVGIWDARLALRPCFDPHVAAVAHEWCSLMGLSGEATPAAVEAACLAAARRARRRHGAAGQRQALPNGDPPHGAGTDGPHPTPRAMGHATVGDRADPEEAAAFLAEVARHYLRPPVVNEALRESPTCAEGAERTGCLEVRPPLSYGVPPGASSRGVVAPEATPTSVPADATGLAAVNKGTETTAITGGAGAPGLPGEAPDAERKDRLARERDAA